MKTLISFISLIITLQSYSQPPHYEDLRLLYADGNFEKLLRKTEKYTLKGCHHSPRVYMWASRALFDMTFDSCGPHTDIMNDAINYAGKGLRKRWNEQDSLLFGGYVDTLRGTVISEIRTLLGYKDYHRLRSRLLKYFRISNNDVSGKHLFGVAQYRTGNKIAANEVFTEADSILARTKKPDGWNRHDLTLFRIGAEEYITYLEEHKDSVRLVRFKKIATPFLE